MFDLALIDAADTAIWQRALETSAVIVTKDEDFALRAQLHRGGPQILWIRYGMCGSCSGALSGGRGCREERGLHTSQSAGDP